MPVPYEGAPTVQPSENPPGDYFRVQATPQAFGAGIAEGGAAVGQAATKIGDFFGEVQTDDAVNTAMTRVNKTLDDYRATTGGDALRARAGAEQEIKDAFDEGRQGLTSLRQRYKYDSTVRSYQYRYVNGIIASHADQQAKAYASKVYADQLEVALNNAANTADDPDKVEAAREMARAAMVKQAQAQGYRDPEDIQRAIERADQAIYKTQIETIAVKDPAKAMELTEQHRTDLGDHYFELADRLKPQIERGQADAITRGIISGNLPTSGRAAPPSSIGSNPNNLGNVKTAAGAANDTPDFVKPDTPVDGVKLAADTLRQGYGGLTLDQIGQKWAPHDAKTWVKNVSAASGIAPDAVPNLGDTDQMGRLLGGIATAEKSPGDRARFTPDVISAGVTASLSGARPVAQVIPAAQQMPPGFPTRGDWIGRIPEGLSDQMYERVYAQVNREYNHLVQATSSERAQTEQTYKGQVTMLADGRDVGYDPQKIRALFPKDTADEMIGNLEDAQAIGRQVVAVRGMSPPEINAQLQSNDNVLSASTGEDYARQKRLAESFRTAAKQHYDALNDDPALYVLKTNPGIEAARKQMESQTPQQETAAKAAGVPTAPEDYAAQMLAEQARLGVPAESRHVLHDDDAVKMAQQVMADPEKAPALLKVMEQHWGSQWPAVFRDLTTVGKLPAAYQAVSILDNERDAALLARALAEQSKSGKEWADLMPNGAKDVTDIKTNVRNNPAVQALVSSLQKSGSSMMQVDGIVKSIDTLAYAKAFYDRDPAAAQNAADSFTSRYEFMPNGGARVPAKTFDNVSDAAADVISRLGSPNSPQISVPTTYGQPGMPQPAEYIDMLRAAPSWITAPQADGILLMDPAGRLVRTLDGQPVKVPFTAPPRAALPASVPEGVYIRPQSTPTVPEDQYLRAHPNG